MEAEAEAEAVDAALKSTASTSLLAPQRYARSVHGLAHSLRLLSHGTVEIPDYVFILLSHYMGINAIVVVTRNTP